MLINKTINCYITSTDDDDEVVMLFKRIEKGNSVPVWGFLEFPISYEEKNKHHFVHQFMARLQSKIQLNVYEVVILDVSTAGDYWVRVQTDSTQFSVNIDNYTECCMFAHDYAKKLPKTTNLAEFLETYPSAEAVEARFARMKQNRVN